MRVISQDGTLDMPYEICTVWCRGSVIMCDMCGDNTTRTVLATYSMEEKAKKAMSELKYAYLSHNQLQITKEIPKAVSDVFPDKMIKAVYGAFQFPADEELE